MERCDSLAALVQHEQRPEFESSDSEGTCSGYDSAPDLLDEDVHLPDIVRQLSLSPKVNNRERMCFQSTSALSSHLRYIISMPELCDVKFLVGEDKYPVYGVKAIMATRSRTLYHLIMKHQRKQETESTNKRRKKRVFAQHLTIDVKKYEPEVFQKIIQFVHCGSVDVNVDNVAGLLCGASQFGLEDLAGACWDFIDRALQQGCVNHIVESAKKYTQHRVITRLFNKVNNFVAGLKAKATE